MKAKIDWPLSNLWAVVRREATKEIAVCLEAWSEHDRVSAEVEGILNPHRLRESENAVFQCKTAAEIMEASVRHASAVTGGEAAQAAASRLKREAQKKMFFTVPPILIVARDVATRARAAIASAEEELFGAFGVAVRKTYLTSFVEGFEREIANIELQMRIMSHHLSPNLIPGCMTVFKAPTRDTRRPILPVGVPYCAIDPRLRITAMSITENERRANRDAATIEKGQQAQARALDKNTIVKNSGVEIMAGVSESDDDEEMYPPMSLKIA